MLTRPALKNKVAVLMIAIAAVVLGYVSLNKISVDLFPNFTFPVVVVGVVYPGAGPKDVEASITYQLERAISSVPNVAYIESASRQGISTVRAYFDWGANVDVGASDCIQRVQQIMSSLPSGAQSPFVIKLDVTNMAVIGLALSSDTLDSRQMYDLAYNTIGPQIEHVNGVSNANIFGGLVRRINVLADRDALVAAGISTSDLSGAISSANFLMPSGSMKVGKIDYNLYTQTQIDKVDEFGDIIVKQATKNGSPVYLKDVATVEDGGEDESNIVRVNGKSGVSLFVRKQPGANTIEVVDAVRKALPKLYGMPQGVKLEPIFDQSQYIRNSINSLIHEALKGAVLAIAVIYFFLRTFRSTVIIAVSIPLSIMATFIMLYFIGGQTLNIFTIGGLALGVGRLVDDSIVVLENIYRNRKNFTTASQAALEGANQVAMPVLASTLTTIAVFFPVVFLTGIAKPLFIPLALAIGFSLTASYFVSMTVVPILCERFVENESDPSLSSAKLSERIAARWKRMFDLMDEFYARLLRWVLRRRAATIAVLAIIFVLSTLMFGKVGSEFFPATDESQFSVNLKLPVGARVEDTNEAANKIVETVYDALGKENVSVITQDSGVRASGTGGMWSGTPGPHAANVRVSLVSPEKRPFSDLEAVEIVRKKLAGKMPGVQVYFSTGGMMNRILNFGSENPIEVQIIGFDFEESGKLARTIQGIVEDVKGTADVRISREDNYPELDVKVDRDLASRMGLTVKDAAQTILTSITGSVNMPSIYTDPITGKEYNIVVRFKEKNRNSIEDLENVPLFSKTGQIVDLRTIAKVEGAAGPIQIDRKYQQRIVKVTANVVGRPLGDVAGEIESKLAGLALPQGFEVTMAGQREQQKESFKSLLMALLLALMLVYMTMASQFNSLLEPFIIMFSVPMGLIGVVWTLYITSTPLSINAYMGIIMMVGIVISNGILLVDFANNLFKQGCDVFDAAVEAGRIRLRPILMTTACTLFGLMPMAIGIGEGSESNAPLARAVVGGLAVSTVFTLLLIPALFTLFHGNDKKAA